MPTQLVKPAKVTPVPATINGAQFMDFPASRHEGGRRSPIDGAPLE
jgi:hypothetical protein